MEETSVIGIDLAKHVFQLCGLSASGEVIWEKRLKRPAFIKFMEEAAPCTVGMEACGGAHYWGRHFQQRGHRPKLMAPKAVKAYRTSVHKNDGRDARATAEAASRPYVAGVAIKTEAAQAAQAVMRVRERRSRQQVQTANQLRGLLNEFGIVAPKGRGRLLETVDELTAAGAIAALPAAMQGIVRELYDEIIEQAGKVNKSTAAVTEAVAKDSRCKLLMTIPHIGPINAAALSIALDVPQAFRSGRAFAASLRLVPRQDASAESNHLLGVGELRNSELRRYLVLAAQSLLIRLVRQKEPPQDPFLSWALRLLRRKPRNVAVVAIAAKLARIAWAVMMTGNPYQLRTVNA